MAAASMAAVARRLPRPAKHDVDHHTRPLRRIRRHRDADWKSPATRGTVLVALRRDPLKLSTHLSDFGGFHGYSRMDNYVPSIGRLPRLSPIDCRGIGRCTAKSRHAQGM